MVYFFYLTNGNLKSGSRIINQQCKTTSIWREEIFLDGFNVFSLVCFLLRSHNIKYIINAYINESCKTNSWASSSCLACWKHPKNHEMVHKMSCDTYMCDASSRTHWGQLPCTGSGWDGVSFFSLQPVRYCVLDLGLKQCWLIAGQCFVYFWTVLA